MKNRNNIIQHIWSCLGALMLISVVACEPMEMEKPELPAPPTESDVQFAANPDSETPNIIHFTNESPGFKAIWDFGNGATAEGNSVQAAYPEAGEYEVTLTIYTAGGSAASGKTISIAEDNYSLLDDPVYNLLTGGQESPEGKIWVMDYTMGGHFGVGPAEGTTAEWWNAGADEKAGAGWYDDEYTFQLSGLTYHHETNGDVFVNNAQAGNFPGGETAGGEWMAPYDAYTTTWSLTETDGRLFLTIKNGWIGMYTGVSKYEIVTLEENELYLRYFDAAAPANAWYVRMVPKGFEHPVVEVPYKIEDIDDDFEGNGNISWFAEEVTGFNPGYDNPAQVPANESPTVARYVRGTGNPYENLQIQLDYKMDIRERHIFKMKVLVPAYNDYSEGLNPTVAVKLQNSDLGGNSWTTQAEILKTIEEDQLGQWVELTFDFSGFAVNNLNSGEQVWPEVSEADSYDRLIIQFGGEGHNVPGIFYFDDFSLLPEGGE